MICPIRTLSMTPASETTTKRFSLSKTIMIMGIVVFGILSIIPPVSSAFLDEKGILYYADLPKNDPYEKIVMPGDTIYLGGVYDLTNVLGSSKEFAWWPDITDVETSCNPAILNSVSYIKTNGAVNYKKVTLDPEHWRVGSWWQWDGCFERANYKENHADYVPYVNDNNLAFKIVRPPTPPKVTMPPANFEALPTASDTPAPEIIITSVPTAPVPPENKDDSVPWWGWAAGSVVALYIIHEFVW